jgi:hypothetical protein
MRRGSAAPALLLALAVGLTACTSASTSTHPPGHNASGSTVYRFGVVGNQGKIAQLELSTPAAVSGITGDVVQIATSNSDSYARTSTGQVWAWGVASYGELGDGQTAPYTTRAVRVDFPPGVKIVALANPVPFDGALAIDSHGHAPGSPPNSQTYGRYVGPSHDSNKVTGLGSAKDRIWRMPWPVTVSTQMP